MFQNFRTSDHFRITKNQTKSWQKCEYYGKNRKAGDFSDIALSVIQPFRGFATHKSLPRKICTSVNSSNLNPNNILKAYVLYPTAHDLSLVSFCTDPAFRAFSLWYCALEVYWHNTYLIYNSCILVVIRTIYQLTVTKYSGLDRWIGSWDIFSKTILESLSELFSRRHYRL